jgi:hypothetical protein
MASQSRRTIKTHARLRSKIGMQSGVCLANIPQISDSLNMTQSGCFSGFPETRKRAIGPDTGLFYPWESIILIGSCEYLSDNVVGENLEFSLYPGFSKKELV